MLEITTHLANYPFLFEYNADLLRKHAGGNPKGTAKQKAYNQALNRAL
jgi:hypothetical protein